jgi:hypothetical protein
LAVRIDDGIMIVGGIFIEYVFVVGSVVCFVFIVHRDVVVVVVGFVVLVCCIVYLSSFYFVGHDESSNGFEHKVQKVGGGDSKFNYFDPPRHN